MLLLGTCNPAGESSDYNGLYLRKDEIEEIVQNGLSGIPVKQEHTGGDIGRVVSCFKGNNGELQCLLELDGSLEGDIAAGFVRDGIATELSLGYSVDIHHSDNNKYRTGKKKIQEISLVRKGARQGCYIMAHNATMLDEGAKDDVWVAFMKSIC